MLPNDECYDVSGGCPVLSLGTTILPNDERYDVSEGFPVLSLDTVVLSSRVQVNNAKSPSMCIVVLHCASLCTL